MAEALQLSLALAGTPSAGDLREDLERVAEAGYRSVQLSATGAGRRPREFDRSARRDLAATIRRLELTVSGVDLWIPSKHFLDSEHVDRAVQAVVDGAEFAGDLATLTAGNALLCVTLPGHSTISGELQTMTAAAEAAGATLVDHQWPPASSEAVAVGFDPAGAMIADADLDAAGALASVSRRVASVRISDLDESGRVPPGDGRMNLMNYLITATTCERVTHAVVDVRGLERAWDAAAQTRVAAERITAFGIGG